MGKENIQFRRHKIRTARAESQEEIATRLSKIELKDKQKVDEHWQLEYTTTEVLHWNGQQKLLGGAVGEGGGGGGGGLNRFTLKKASSLVLLWLKHIQGVGSAWRTSNSFIHQNSNHITQDPTILNWNKMRTQQQDPYWNTGATDILQLNPKRPDQRQSIEPQPIVLNMFRPEPSFISSAIKEGSC